MSEPLTAEQLGALVGRVFEPQQDERRLALLVDLPDERTPDHPSWQARRALAIEWCTLLRRALPAFEVELVLYRNVGLGNADLPEQCAVHRGGPIPANAVALDDLLGATGEPFSTLLARVDFVLALTEFSATAPLKLAARQLGFRGATMGGFNDAMVPALALDYGAVNRRVCELAQKLSRATRAELEFETSVGRCALTLDLRFREPHVSGGLFLKPGTVGNLPSGETYIVPYEGERAGDPSGSCGILPVQFGDEIVCYEIEQNRAVRVTGDGPIAERERQQLLAEPAYGNIAELGLGVLSEFGIGPIGEVLLDEKLGLHLAFGRSDHFGGVVGAAQFSSKDSVVHIDRVYIRETQPQIKASLNLVDAEGQLEPIVRDGTYV